jgi:hypothetical protein
MNMKVKTLTDIRVVCDPPNMRYWGDMEQQARAMERWCDDFNEFIRDHRSQDQVNLSVERVYEEICSICKCTYEADASGPLCCNKAIEEYESQNVKAESV